MRRFDLPGRSVRLAPVIQRAADGMSASSTSSAVVAGMLEQPQAEPGNAILEKGAATRFSAALLTLLCLL